VRADGSPIHRLQRSARKGQGAFFMVFRLARNCSYLLGLAGARAIPRKVWCRWI